MLLLAAALAIVCANTPLANFYHTFIQSSFGIGPPGSTLSLTIGEWFSEGLLAVFFLVAGLSLLLETPAMAQGDFLSLRARCQRDLLRDQQRRAFLSWLWFAPLLLLMHQQIVTNKATGFAMTLTLSGVGVIVLCFFIAAFNRENRGRTQEQIRLLDRAREKLA